MSLSTKGGQCISLRKRPFPLPRQVQKGIQRRVRTNELKEYVRFKVEYKIPGADPDDTFVRLTMVHYNVDFAKDMVVKLDFKTCENPAINEGKETPARWEILPIVAPVWRQSDRGAVVQMRVWNRKIHL